MSAPDEIMTVIALKNETPDIVSIVLRGKSGAAPMDRKPGQYITLSLRDRDTWTPPHPFTVSNAPASETIRLTVKRAGVFTGMIHALHPGEEVKVGGPYGKFCGSVETSENAVMIAGGIGITPFLSVLRHYQRKTPGLKSVTLFWGNPHPGNFFSLSEIDSYYFFANFTAVIVSESPFLWKHLKKHRVSTLKFEEGLLTAGLLKKYADFRDADVFICGSGPMQEFVRSQLRECGVTDEKIEAEKFGG